MNIGNFMLDPGHVIGQGNFGKVYKGSSKNNSNVAIKQFQNSCNFSRSVIYEMRSLMAINHKHVVRILGVQEERHNVYLVMEYCNSGNLRDYLNNHSLNTNNKIKLMHECACAVSYLHNLQPPIIHKNLKLENILIDEKPNTGAMAKLSDFGLYSAFDTLKQNSTDSVNSYLSAPELYQNNNELKSSVYTTAVDTFSLGIIFQIMINHSKQWKRSPESDMHSLGLQMTLQQEKGESFSPLFTVEADEKKPIPQTKLFIATMLSYNYRERPHMAEVEREFACFRHGITLQDERLDEVRQENLHQSQKIKSLERELQQKKSASLENQSKEMAIKLEIAQLETMYRMERDQLQVRQNQLEHDLLQADHTRLLLQDELRRSDKLRDDLQKQLTLAATARGVSQHNLKKERQKLQDIQNRIKIEMAFACLYLTLIWSKGYFSLADIFMIILNSVITTEIKLDQTFKFYTKTVLAIFACMLLVSMNFKMVGMLLNFTLLILLLRHDKMKK